MTIDPAFFAKMERDGAPENVPWRIANHDGRVALCNSNGRVMVAIDPAQIVGCVVTTDEKLEIAQFILGAVNKCAADPTP